MIAKSQFTVLGAVKKFRLRHPQRQAFPRVLVNQRQNPQRPSIVRPDYFFCISFTVSICAFSSLSRPLP